MRRTYSLRTLKSGGPCCGRLRNLGSSLIAAGSGGAVRCEPSGVAGSVKAVRGEGHCRRTIPYSLDTARNGRC